MKGFPFKRNFILLVSCILAIGVIVPIASFAKSASGEQHIPIHSALQMVKFASGGFSFSKQTDVGCVPGPADNITPPLTAGDKVAGSVGLTVAAGVDPAEEAPEGETLLIADTAGSFSKVIGFISGTAPFSFTVPSTGDVLTACIQGGVGDEIGTVSGSVTPLTATDRANRIWAGYISSGTTYSSVDGAWTVPHVHCSLLSSDVAIWVGIGGVGVTTLEQIGIAAICSFGQLTYTGVFENYPAGIVTIDKACKGLTITGNPKKCPMVSAVIKPGDKMVASVSFTAPDKFGMSLTNLTQKWLFTTTQTVPGVTRSSAECIVERPVEEHKIVNGIVKFDFLRPLARFDNVDFSSCDANGTSIGTAGPSLFRAFATDNGKPSGKVLMEPGKLINNDSFSVMWRDSDFFAVIPVCFFNCK